MSVYLIGISNAFDLICRAVRFLESDGVKIV